MKYIIVPRRNIGIKTPTEYAIMGSKKIFSVLVSVIIRLPSIGPKPLEVLMKKRIEMEKTAAQEEMLCIRLLTLSEQTLSRTLLNPIREKVRR